MNEEFADFYRVSRDRIHRTVIAATGSFAEAEEATAEAFARALSRWAKVSKHPNREAWVVTTAINFHRSTWRKMRRLVPLGVHEPAPVQPVAHPDPIVERVLELTPRQREAIALCVLLSLDSHAAGELLGISPSTVRVHLHRGLDAIRAAIREEEHQT